MSTRLLRIGLKFQHKKTCTYDPVAAHKLDESVKKLLHTDLLKSDIFVGSSCTLTKCFRNELNGVGISDLRTRTKQCSHDLRKYNYILKQ